MSSLVTSPGVNKTYEVTLGTAFRAFHKPFGGVDVPTAMAYGHLPDEPPVHEGAAWRLAHGLGSPYDEMLPPTVMRDIPPGGWGSLTGAAEGVPNSRDPYTYVPLQVEAAAFWDCLVAQQDRHSGNMRWSSLNGRLSLIDHGYAFARPGDFINSSNLLDWRLRAGSGALTATETAVLKRLIASPNQLKLGGILESSRLQALVNRCHKMLVVNHLLAVGDF